MTFFNENNGKLEGGYQAFYEHLIKGLKTANLNNYAQNVGFKTDINNKEIKVNFLNDIYIIDKTGIYLQNKNKKNLIPLLCVLAHYFLNDVEIENPSPEFLSLNRLKGPLATGSNLGGSMNNNQFKRAFNNNFELLKQTAEKLGGHFLNTIASGAYAWLFDDLPKLPFQLTFHQGDSEFPEEYEILFPKNCLNFMEFESVAYLGGSATKLICNASQNLFN